MKRFLISFLIFTTSSLAMAQGTSLRTVVSQARAGRAETVKDWKLSAAFASATDINESDAKRPYTNSLDIGFDYDLRRDISASVGTGLVWEADGNNIRHEEGNPASKDLTVALGWKTKLLSNSMATLAASEDLPTGSESRAEQVKSVLGAEAELDSLFFEKNLVWVNSLGVNRLIQTFDSSPNTLESNPDTVTSVGTRLVYKVTSHIAIGAAASAKSVHFINGENVLRTSTSEFISYGYRNWKFNLAYVLGQYDKNDSYKFLYLDDTHRFIKFGVQVEI
jgi:hypothetical protein